MTRLKHTAHIKVPHRSNPQKMGVSHSKELKAIVVMPKYGRGPMMSTHGIKEYKAWKKLPITIERGVKKKLSLIKPKKGEKRGFFEIPETDGEMLARANDEMMKHHVDSTWLKFKHKHYNTPIIKH